MAAFRIYAISVLIILNTDSGVKSPLYKCGWFFASGLLWKRCVGETGIGGLSEGFHILSSCYPAKYDNN